MQELATIHLKTKNADPLVDIPQQGIGVSESLFEVLKDLLERIDEDLFYVDPYFACSRVGNFHGN
jgi:hypothetical protein